MKLENATQVVIADSEKYLILQNQGDEEFLDLRVVESVERINPSSRDQGTDRPGRVHLPNAQLSEISHSNWHQLEKEKAASDLADRINQFDTQQGLVLLADAKTLGMVRPKLNSETNAKMISSLPKDLTHHTIPDIEKLIQAA